MAWGKRPPEGYVGPSWGARAIFDRPPDVFSFLADRKSADGSDPEELRAMFGWLNNTGMDLLRAKLRAENVHADDDFNVEVRQDGYILQANPNGSCGYLYLGCWLVRGLPDG